MTHSKRARRLRILFVGFQDQDNLGLRYLMSAAASKGHDVDIETFTKDHKSLVARALRERPDVIGLSLIFQYMTPQFAAAIKALRDAGVRAHITLGGHYPSFDYEAVMKSAPGADSIIRFEGEATLMELCEKLAAGEEWREIEGVAHRLDDGSIRATKLRKQVEDLDTLPWPDRASINYEGNDQPTASVLGSRGCPWNCDFCSIRPFYEAQPGKLRRLRAPKQVVEEMRALYHDRGVATFLFQDDGFLATGRRAREWAGEIADLIAASDIAGKIGFKISCRSDEIREDIIERLKRGGLTHVYMGVESGDEQGLKNMNKMLKPEKHLEAGRILKKAGLSFDFGFMLLEPWSDIRMTRANIDFLDAFVGDGWTVASFCRMLPYSGTPVEKRLKKEGRLKGTALEPDYSFIDPKLDLFYEWMLVTFHERNFTSQGLCHLLRSMIFESRRHPLAERWMTVEETRWLQHIAALTNGVATTVLKSALDHIEATPLEDLSPADGRLAALTDLERVEEKRLTDQISTFFLDPDRQARRGAARRQRLSGGFARSWTFAEADWETRGLGAREAR